MKNEKYYDQFITTVPNFPKPGIMFKDVTTTLENPDAFENCINDLAELASKYEVDKIVCADARGFIFGSPLAFRMHKGLVIARKPNKLPRPGLEYSYHLEYGDNTLVISEGSVKKGERFLLVDDLLATGGSCIAMMKMLQSQGAIPVAAVFYIELPDLKGAEAIKQVANIDVHSLIKYDGE